MPVAGCHSPSTAFDDTKPGDYTSMDNGLRSGDSYHVGGFQISMMDGSVRFYSKTNSLPTTSAEVVARTNTGWDAIQRLAGCVDGDTLLA